MKLIRLIRIHHWVKNFFIFIPIFFAGEITNLSKIALLMIGFVLFGLIASSIYILNDYRDVEEDRKHPTKKDRPLASGSIPVPVALFVMGVFILVGFIGAFLLNINFAFILLAYFGLNLCYSLGLKKISILDVLILSFGFVLRTIAGGVIADVSISQWLIIMIFLLALFLAFAKRRDDILLYQVSGKVMRKSVESYNIEFVNSVLTLLSGVITVAYLMYTVSPEVIERMGTPHLYFTGIFVIAGIMRYLQITVVENNSTSPVKILYKDHFIQLTLTAWIISYFVIIYLA